MSNISDATCANEVRVTTLERQFESLESTIKKMEDRFDTKLDLILFQINKIAVLEAGHATQANAVSRAFDKIESLETELASLKDFRSHTQGMARMAWLLWGTVGIAVAGVIFKLLTQVS